MGLTRINPLKNVVERGKELLESIDPLYIQRLQNWKQRSIGGLEISVASQERMKDHFMQLAARDGVLKFRKENGIPFYEHGKMKVGSNEEGIKFFYEEKEVVSEWYWASVLEYEFENPTLKESLVSTYTTVQGEEKELSPDQSKSQLEVIKKYVQNPKGFERIGLNMDGLHRDIEISTEKKGITSVKFGEHDAYGGLGEETPQVAYTKPLSGNINVPVQALSLSEVMEQLDVDLFTVICHQYFPEITRKNFLSSLPHGHKRRVELEEVQREARLIFKREYKEGIDVDSQFGTQFAISFPVLVDYLQERKKIRFFSCIRDY